MRNDPTPGAALFRTIAELDGGAAFIVDAASGRLSYISPAIETLTGYPPAAFAAHIDGSATDALLAPVCRLIYELLSSLETQSMMQFRHLTHRPIRKIRTSNVNTYL